MKKSNVILTAVAVAASAFLLWLWFHLGFNEVDSPRDLVLSVAWWAIAAAGAALVAKTEATRRRAVRTVYLGEGRLYNSETGVRAVRPGTPAADQLADVLANLEYGFDKIDGPDPDDERERVAWEYVVRTDKFEPASDSDRETWEGEVVTVATGESRGFADRSQLAALIA